MQIKVSKEAQFILDQLSSAKYQAYIVGGAVRDLVMTHQTSESPTQAQLDRPHPLDYDFTTDATPDQIMAVFPDAFYENEYGTVSITPEHLDEMMKLGGENQNTTTPIATVKKHSTKIIDLARATKIHDSLKSEQSDSSQLLPEENKTSDPTPTYQITTFRSDGVYSDHRRPESVTWGTSLEEDLKRRDFSVNAMALSDKLEIIDPHGGVHDLEARVIKTVGDPQQRFHEDALRMLRAVRLSVQLGFQIDAPTRAAIKSQATNLAHISWERVRDEFLKILISTQPKKGIELLDELGLLIQILPELLDAKGVEQSGHHTTDVWTHSLDALQTCPSSDPIVRLATLLHDISKPETRQLEGTKYTFYNHEILGSRLAKRIAARLRLSRRDCTRVYTLVRFHMFHYQAFHTDAAIRRFMRMVGLENIDDILDLREGDRLGSGARQTSWRLEEMKARMIEQLHQPFAISDLKINGDVLMKNLGLKPGPELGKILRELFEHVLEHPEDNEEVKLLELAQKIGVE